MDIKTILIKLSKGNSGALNVLISCFKKNEITGIGITGMLESKNITGDEIWMLYSDCCNKDLNLFINTVMLIQDEFVSMKDVRANFEYGRSCRAIPIISDTTLIDKAKEQGIELSPIQFELWNEFCSTNAAIFKEKIKAITGDQK